MKFVVIGVSHHVSPVALREQFAFAEAQIPAQLKALRATGTVAEAVILSTCNRVEIYAASPLEPVQVFAALKQFLMQRKEILDHPLADEASAGIYTLSEPHSLHHLFKVASGLDSMVLGETEILGQLKTAYALAQTHQHTGAKLNKAFQRAFNVAKHIRTETNIQRGSVSVASVAVELAEKIFSALDERTVLILGAGETSEKVARALLSRGAKSLIVSNRSPERAEALAREFGGRTVPFDDWSREFERVDIVISSTSAPHPILDRAKLEPLMRSRKNRPLLLVDIAVPRDIDPAVNFLGNVYLYNIDDLQAIADDYLKMRKEEIVRCEQIIAEKARPLLEAKTSEPPINANERELKPFPAGI
jgi:glutamyl-tRNA reductase